MIAPVFAAAGIAAVPLLAATTALCLSIESVRIALSKGASAAPDAGGSVGSAANAHGM